ncbi:MAG: ribonuclease J [Negativicutes bacterium]|nr:ribonuclease J [Negativicutes bacterium]
MNRQSRPASGKLQVIPLGGLTEIGKNMTVFRWQDDIIVADCGLKFPDDEMLGIDMVIPDMTYLQENADRVRAVMLTHGHEDHIGALPYFLRQFNVPVYGSRLTLGLVASKLREHNLTDRTLIPIASGQTVAAGAFSVQFIRVTHSIADAMCLAITSPVGTVVHTGDFKFDQSPVDGNPTDYQRLAELGARGVLALLSDSTNAERPGYTMGERSVGETLDEALRNARGRVLVATFSSNIHRVQQVLDVAWKYGRRVAVIGRSMENVVKIAAELGYINIPDRLLVSIDDIDGIPPEQMIIMTTGSQGEPMSALSRMASNEHRKVSITPGDTVVISAQPIPGNEKMVARTVDNLFRQGADVIYQKTSGMHVSGHASQEELKLMINLVRPRYFIPVHGEYRMLMNHAKLAIELGIDGRDIVIADNGSVIEMDSESVGIAGKVAAETIMVDGLGIGDVGNIVMRDRRQLSQDGIIIVVSTVHRPSGMVVAGPEVVSRGFVYMKEAEDLMAELREAAGQAMGRCLDHQQTDWTSLKTAIRDAIGRVVYAKTHRRPMVIPIIMDVE